MVLKDGAGHAADPAAITELEEGGLAKRDGDRAAFTDEGKAKLAAVIEALRGA